MNPTSPPAAPGAAAYEPIPADNPARQLTIARPDTDPALPHVGVAGGTYTILLQGSDTGGRYTIIDMHVPPEGGPPPHRHDFEETFSVLEGEIEIVFRGETLVARAGEMVHVPANAPHGFRNVASSPARLLCICAPAGQEEFFLEVGAPLPTRDAALPTLDPDAQAAFVKKALSLAPKYRSELLVP